MDAVKKLLDKKALAVDGDSNKWQGAVGKLSAFCHEVNEGQPCFNCGIGCPGFGLHFWRKNCRHCKCSPFAHALIEAPKKEKKIGKLPEEKKRQWNQTKSVNPFDDDDVDGQNDNTTPEPESVAHAAEVHTSSASESAAPAPPRPKGPKPMRGSSESDNDSTSGFTHPQPSGSQDDGEEDLPHLPPTLRNVPALDDTTVFVYVPDGLDQEQALSYFQEPYPLQCVPVKGTDGERKFKMAMETQMPGHDFHADMCDSLNADELKAFESFKAEKRSAHEEGIVARQEIAATCSTCDEGIEKGALAVHIRQLPDEYFHPHCFQCSQCDEILAGLNAFVNNGYLFCGRHWADHFKARCHACDETIYEPQFLKAEGHPWHAKHFCCFGCDAGLAGEPYIPVEESIYCEPCYSMKFAKSCSACKMKIEAAIPSLQYGEEVWHSVCFKCCKCRVPLEGKDCVNKDGKMWCRRDYLQFYKMGKDGVAARRSETVRGTRPSADKPKPRVSASIHGAPGGKSEIRVMSAERYEPIWPADKVRRKQGAAPSNADVPPPRPAKTMGGAGGDVPPPRPPKKR